MFLQIVNVSFESVRATKKVCGLYMTVWRHILFEAYNEFFFIFQKCQRKGLSLHKSIQMCVGTLGLGNILILYRDIYIEIVLDFGYLNIVIILLIICM